MNAYTGESEDAGDDQHNPFSRFVFERRPVADEDKPAAARVRSRSRSPSNASARSSRSRSRSRSPSRTSQLPPQQQEFKADERRRSPPRRRGGGSGGRGRGVGRGRPLHEQPAADHPNAEMKSVSVPLFEGDYGDPSPADSWCFMSDLSTLDDNPDDPDPKRKMLNDFAARYGSVDTFRLVLYCEQWYNTKIRPLVDGNRQWTRRSIKKWLENQATSECIKNYTRRVLHTKLVMMTETALVTLDPVTGQKTENGEADKRLEKLVRALRALDG